MKFEEVLTYMTCLNAGCEGLPQGHCYHFQNLRAAHAEEVERARLSVSAAEIEKAAHAAGVAEGRREMAREILNQWARWEAGEHDAVYLIDFKGWLEVRAGEEKK